MLNEKMINLGEKRSVIRELFEYGNKRKAEIGAENVYDFSLGNPSVPAPESVKESIERLNKTCDPIFLHGYTSAVGDLNTRKAIADHINREYNAGAKPEFIYMTAGAAASLTITLNAVAGEGEEVIAFAPFFPEYRVFVENTGAEFRPVMSDTESFQIDFENLEKAINKKTAAVIVNSPNNPTGAVLKTETIKRLCEVLKAKQEEYGREIYLISDEPYRELVYGDIEVPYLTNYYDNTIVCYSYSKSLSLPGERIGYIFVSPKADKAQKVYAAVCGAGRALGFVCAPSLFQRVITENVDAKADVEKYKENRDLLYNALKEYGYEAVSPDGAFYLFVKALCDDANEFAEKAKKFELLVVPSDDFGIEGYVRISYCVSREQIERSLPAFKKLIESYR